MILLQIVMVSPGTDLVKNEESQRRSIECQCKNTSALGLICNHTVSKDRLQNSVVQFTEVKIFSFYCRSQQRLKEICAVKQQPQEQPHKSHKWDILQKPLQFEQSITKKLFPCASFFFTGLVWKVFVSGY